jgi:hypothetical protein
LAEGEKNGLLVNLESVKDGDGASMGGQSVKSVDDVINILESKKESCKVTAIDDSKFVLPSNVTFKEF